MILISSEAPARSRVRVAAALAVLCLAASAPASSADAPVASDPVFKALVTDGTTVSGRIRQFGPNGDLSLVAVDGSERILPIETLVKLARDGVSPTLTPDASVLLFPDGDRLYRTGIGAANDTSLDVQSYALGNLSIPLESLLGLVFSLPTTPEALDALLQRVRSEPRTSEVLWLANNDRIAAGFLGLSDKNLDYQRLGAKPESIERARVVALGFDPSLVVYPKPDAAFLELSLSDGSRLGVTSPTVEQGYVLATSRFGAKLRVPIAEIVRIHARSRTVDYLADRPIAAEKSITYVGPSRPARRDATVEGNPFRLGGQDYDRGLGTQSRTFLVYDVKPTDHRFQALVGLDDRAGPLGNVTFRVLVDRDERFVSPPMSAGDPPRTIDVDLSGAKRLILITEFGERGGVRDIADWVEARIVR